MVNTILGRKLGTTPGVGRGRQRRARRKSSGWPLRRLAGRGRATDGYDARPIGFGDIKAKHVSKPMSGHFAAAGVEPMRFLREVRVPEGEEHATGEKVTVADFADVKTVDVIGTSRARASGGHEALELRWR